MELILSPPAEQVPKKREAEAATTTSLSIPLYRKFKQSVSQCFDLFCGTGGLFKALFLTRNPRGSGVMAWEPVF